MTNAARALDPHATLRSFLEHMARIEASDLYLTAGSPPVFRVKDVTYIGRVAVDADEITSMSDSLMNVAQRQEFRAKLEMNLTFSLTENVRFRVNLLWQRGAPGMVVRSLRTAIKTLDELGHPSTMKTLALASDGLVLIVGRRGSGISSTLAAMIDQRNSTETGHILTIEDPIELIHPRKQCVVTQREVGVDTRSYADALSNAVRQTPDVIVIDAIRSGDVLEAAFGFADSGHLCISTLHAVNIKQAIHGMLSLFSPTRHAEILLRLSLTLRGMVSQRLVPSVDGGRVAALELLLDTERIKETIRAGQIDALQEAMEQDDVRGCCSFDASLLALLRAGRVNETDALNAADSRIEFAQRIGRPIEQVQRLRSTPPELDVALRLAADPYDPERAVVPRTTKVAGR